MAEYKRKADTIQIITGTLLVMIQLFVVYIVFPIEKRLIKQIDELKCDIIKIEEKVDKTFDQSFANKFNISKLEERLDDYLEWIKKNGL